ncbi:hypothetical protein AB0B63_21030 [Micromonospora sp. NPDC049081]
MAVRPAGPWPCVPSVRCPNGTSAAARHRRAKPFKEATVYGLHSLEVTW